MNNSVLENIKTRRTVRKFSGRAIPKDSIERIVEAAGFAPSALNRQPWRFVVITDRGVIEELARTARRRIKKLYKLLPLLKLIVRDLRDAQVANTLKKTAESDDDTVFYNAPLLILVANDARSGGTLNDCYLAAENMALAAHSLGIGSCFIGKAKAIPKATLRRRFDIPRFYDMNIFMVFGYPDEPQRTPPPRKAGAVKWVR